MATKPPGEGELNDLFRFYLCIGFVITEFSKLEKTLDYAIVCASRMAERFEWEVGSSIPFGTKKRILENICKSTDSRMVGHNLWDEYKKAGLSNDLEASNGHRNSVAHGLWTAMREHDKKFRVIYRGEHLDWSLEDMMVKFDFIMATNAKLRAFGELLPRSSNHI